MTPPSAGGTSGVGVTGAGDAGNVAVGPGGGRVGTSPVGIVGDGSGVVGRGAGVVAVGVAVAVDVWIGEVGCDCKSRPASEGDSDPAIARVVRKVTTVTSANNALSRERRLRG